jgi:hypothetical protein
MKDQPHGMHAYQRTCPSSLEKILKQLVIVILLELSIATLTHVDQWGLKTGL